MARSHGQKGFFLKFRELEVSVIHPVIVDTQLNILPLTTFGFYPPKSCKIETKISNEENIF